MAGENGGLGRAVLELATDDKQFNAGLAEAKNKAQGLEGTFAGAGAQASTFGQRLALLGKQAGLAGSASEILKSTIGQFTIAGLATNAITALGGALKDFVIKGTQLPAIENSFNRLTGALRLTSATMLNEMRAGTQSLVSDLDLMQAANKAMLLGLPVTEKSMGELANTARVLGKAMGQDATKSLDDLITALGRSSPMILDNLGLTVKVGEANEAYAKKLGKTADALTDGEKKLAFYEAALAAARVKTEQLGEQTQTLGEIATSVWTKIGNVITETSASINVGLGAALSNRQNFVMFLDNVNKMGFAAAVTMAGMAEQAKNLASSLPKRPDVFLETFEGSLARVRASITSTSAVVPTLTAQQKELALAMNASGKSAAEIAAKLSEVQGWKVSEASVQKLIDAHKKGTEAAKKHGDEIDRLVAKLSGAGLAQSVKDLDVALERLRANGPLTGQAIGAVGEEAARLRDEGARLTPALAELARVHDLATIAARNTAAAADAEAAAWERDRAAFGRYAAQVPTAIFATRSFAGAVAQVSAEAAKFQGNMAGVDMGPKFWARTFGSAKDFGASLSNAIMGALQGGGSVVNAAGGMIGQQLGTSIAGSLSKSLLAKGAGMLSQALGGMLNAVLPGVGALLGPLMSKAWNGIKSLFGGNRDGRKMVESWVSDTFGSFDSLQKQLIEKIGGPEADRLWRNLTQLSKNSSTDEARRAIEAVTEALARQKDQIDENADAAAQGAAETAAAQAEAADAIRAKYADAFKAIDDEYKKLSDSVAAEAEEAEMGAQERLDRARMAELEKQRAALEAQQNAELESKSETFDAILAGGKTVDEALRGIFGRELVIPYRFVGQNSPDGVEVPVEPMAAGGRGRVLRPTLFYSAGDEDFAFSGEGRSFGLGALGSRPTVIENVITLDGRVLARNQARHLPNELERVGIRSR